MSNIGSHGMEKKKRKNVSFMCQQHKKLRLVFMFTAIKSRGAEK